MTKPLALSTLRRAAKSLTPDVAGPRFVKHVDMAHTYEHDLRAGGKLAEGARHAVRIWLESFREGNDEMLRLERSAEAYPEAKALGKLFAAERARYAELEARFEVLAKLGAEPPAAVEAPAAVPAPAAAADEAAEVEAVIKSAKAAARLAAARAGQTAPNPTYRDALSALCPLAAPSPVPGQFAARAAALRAADHIDILGEQILRSAESLSAEWGRVATGALHCLPYQRVAADLGALAAETSRAVAEREERIEALNELFRSAPAAFPRHIERAVAAYLAAASLAYSASTKG